VERNVQVAQINLDQVDVGKLAIALVDAATVVIGTPTLLGGAHPNAAYAALLANLLRPKAKHASVIGSYGWGGRVAEQLAGLMSSLKVDMLPPVFCRGLPSPADLAQLDALADTIAAKHREMVQP
jgi:flavorubredoxin